MNILGRTRSKDQLQIFIRRLPKCGMKRWIMCSYLGLQAWEKRPWPLLSNELGVNLKQTSGPVIEKAGDLVAILNDLEPRDVLLLMRFIACQMSVEEVL